MLPAENPAQSNLTLRRIEDSRELRRAFACFPSGVAAICAMAGETPIGMAVSSFTSVSLAPTLVSVCIQRTSTTWPKLRTARHFGLSILGEHQELTCAQLSQKTGDRFASTHWSTDETGAVFIDGASLWLDCTLHDEVEAGDHLIALLEVARVHVDNATPPLVFHESRFRRLALAPSP